MKWQNAFLYSVLFAACSLATADIVKFQLTGDHLWATATSAPATVQNIACTSQPAPARAPTTDVQLKALGEYEAACQSAFASHMMLFTNMPISTANAQDMAKKMALRLKEFKSHNITPIVVVEPDSQWGLVDFHEFATGLYDPWIADYFKQLKAEGITEESLGVWMPFPEPQQEYWNNNDDPDDFAHAINRYFKILRGEFASGKTAILLDSQVGESAQAPQLLAFVRLVDNSLVDTVGIQGFPWHPPTDADTRKPVTLAGVFAPASLAKEVASSLGTKNVLLNIGTYRHRKAASGGDIAIPTQQRQDTLASIVHEVDLLKQDGYAVTVNIFAENKLNVREGVDWSYWQRGQYQNGAHTPLFTSFVHDLSKTGALISLFDARDK